MPSPDANTITLYVPPEVAGCLAHAERHLKTGNALSKRRWPERERKRKHMEKVQKLVSKAVRLLERREVT